LKSLEVTGWSHPVHRFAVRTPKPPQPKPYGDSIEEGQYKPVKPKPCATAFGTTVRSGPGEISLFLQNFIEGNAHSQYHRITLFTGPPGPVHASGGRSIKPPPASYHRSTKDPILGPTTLKTPLHSPAYSENPAPFLTIQIDTLQMDL
jgi:hypothetical protein